MLLHELSYSKNFNNNINKRLGYKMHFSHFSTFVDDAISAFISSAHDFSNGLGFRLRVR